MLSLVSAAGVSVSSTAGAAVSIVKSYDAGSPAFSRSSMPRTSKRQSPSPSVVISSPDSQAYQGDGSELGVRSRLHSKDARSSAADDQVKAGVVSLDSSSGVSSSWVPGPVVSTVKVDEAGDWSVSPLTSTARTSNV